MIYIFPETEKANERAREVLKSVKEEYQKPQMSEEQLEGLRQVMQKAKEEVSAEEKVSKKKERNRIEWRKFAATAAVRRPWLVCRPPVVISIVALCCWASYRKYSSLRSLLPPIPRPVRSSLLRYRLMPSSREMFDKYSIGVGRFRKGTFFRPSDMSFTSFHTF